MRKSLKVVAVVGMLGACRNRQAQAPEPQAVQPAPDVADARASIDPRTIDAAIAVAPPAVAAWPGETPRLPAELHDRNPLGQSLASLALNPDVLETCPGGIMQCFSIGAPGVRVALLEDQTKHVIIYFALMTMADAKPMLERAWGKPDACGRWVNRDRWLAVSLETPWPMFKDVFASSVAFQTAPAWLVVQGLLQPAPTAVALGKPSANTKAYFDTVSEGVTPALTVREAGGLISSLVVNLGCSDERASIAAMLTPALGAPTEEAEVSVWRNEARGLLVTLDDKDLKVAPYKSVKSTLQAAKGTWSFESKRLLGTPWPELLAAYQAPAEAGPGVWQLQLTEDVDEAHKLVADRSGRIEVPGQEPLTFTFVVDRRNRVRGYVVMLRYGSSAEVKGQLLALIENRYGKGTPRPDDVEVSDLSASPKVWLRDHLSAQRFEIVVGAVTEREYVEMLMNEGI